MLYTTHSTEHAAYHSARQRCINPKNVGYKNYGGRGIQFKFKNFMELFNEVGPKPTPAHSLDRRNNEGHYEPGNVRWATGVEQHNNKRRRGFTSTTRNKGVVPKVLRTHAGDGTIEFGWTTPDKIKITLSDLARRLNLSVSTISRYFSGERIPTFWVGLQIAHELDIDPWELAQLLPLKEDV